MGIKGRGRSGRSRDSNPACLCCSSAHLVQCEPDEASSFTNPNVGPGTYASLRLKLDAWSSAVQRGQKCSSPTRRLPSRSWGPIRPRVCSWFRAPIRHECQTAQRCSRLFSVISGHLLTGQYRFVNFVLFEFIYIFVQFKNGWGVNNFFLSSVLLTVIYQVFLSNTNIAGAVEYTNCISAEG